MGAERAARVLVPAALVALALAGGAAAQDRIDVGGVTVTAYSAWPPRVGKGYVPIRVVIENTGRRPQRVALEATCGWGSDGYTVTRAVKVEPGETFESDLVAPTFRGAYGGYRMSVAVPGEDPQILHNLATLDGHRETIHSIVVLAARRETEAAVEAWNERVKSADIQLYGRTVPDVSAASVTFDDAPRRFEAYTSLDAVVVDTQDGVPPADALDPLFAWARLGGNLILAGPRARTLVAEQPALGRWAQERFRVVEDAEAIGPPHRELFRFGHGRLGIASAGTPFAGADDVALLHAAFEHRGQVPRGDRTSRRFSYPPTIPGAGELPYRVLTALLVAFALAIGPLNYLVSRRLGRPSLLLVTIPLLALLASAGVLAYGVFHQGLGTRVASRSFTVLDQRAHAASTVECRTFFAGLTPAEGLRPGPGAACFPELDVPWGRARNVASFEVEHGEGTLLSGAFLPVRRITTQTLLSETPARARLNLAREGGAAFVENALGARVELLLLRDPGGGWHRAAGPVDPGARVALESVEPDEAARVELAARELFHDGRGGLDPLRLERAPLARLDELWPASYFAVLDASPFLDDCGIEMETVVGQHMVFGVMDPSDEGWR